MRVLVANRGEIAVRIVRACRELGVGVVAVHSDADAAALHTRMADAAVRIGPAPSRESYLNQAAVLQAAHETGCNAIHPGYGFLSENAAFARAVGKAGLTWIGPPPQAMERMGDKTRARREAKAAGVPVAAGTETLTDANQAAREADRIGYPVLLKASAGGGGIGMRVVRSASEMEAQFRSARDQAQSAFGVPDVFLEQYLERPRHIEIQVLADAHGHAIHLGERECSIQRRHQKLVEEAPSPALTPEMRLDIGAKAVALAKRVGYVNAGTMEFLLQDGRLHFNEMNTRLQVEHPVTELVTGIDLVQWQIRIARGERLSVKQEDVLMRGHAFEARINAEDPARGFAPTPGPVRRVLAPHGPGVRFDTGIRDGWTVPSEYDSMVAKLLVHAQTREAAVARMQRALSELRVEGLTTNQSFHEVLFANERFQAGDLTTRFLEEEDIAGEIANQDAAETSRRRMVASIVAGMEATGGVALWHARQASHSTGPKRNWEEA